MTSALTQAAIASVTSKVTLTDRGPESTIQWLREPVPAGTFLYEAPFANWTIARDKEGIIAIAPSRSYFHVRDDDDTALAATMRQLCQSLQPSLPTPFTFEDDLAEEDIVKDNVVIRAFSGILRGVTFAAWNPTMVRASSNGRLYFAVLVAGTDTTPSSWTLDGAPFATLAAVADYIGAIPA